ncbi:DoxX family protein [Croceitalea dokdonensis]|nr:DoxX family membrane protein [Croceitalea dokdonensis]
MKDKKSSKTYTVIVLRVLIGWHFLYEGIVKLYNPEWTAYGYLASAQGPFKPVFNLMLADSVVSMVDAMNMAALIFVGVTLLLGVFERAGALVGIGLLALYYLAHPPFPGLAQINVEGNYWFVNKNLIEMVACMVLLQFPTGHVFGIQALTKYPQIKKKLS